MLFWRETKEDWICGREKVGENWEEKLKSENNVLGMDNFKRKQKASSIQYVFSWKENIQSVLK